MRSRDLKKRKREVACGDLDRIYSDRKRESSSLPSAQSEKKPLMKKEAYHVKSTQELGKILKKSSNV